MKCEADSNLAGSASPTPSVRIDSSAVVPSQALSEFRAGLNQVLVADRGPLFLLEDRCLDHGKLQAMPLDARIIKKVPSNFATRSVRCFAFQRTK